MPTPVTGNVTDLMRDVWSMPEPNSGCWLWLGGLGTKGYGHVRNAATEPLGAGERAHRVSFAAFRGPIPDGLQVLHKCDVRSCVNPEHLFIGTNEDNVQDAINKRRRQGRPRSTPSRGRREIIAAVLADDRPARVVALDYDMHPRTIERIISKHGDLRLRRLQREERARLATIALDLLAACKEVLRCAALPEICAEPIRAVVARAEPR